MGLLCAATMATVPLASILCADVMWACTWPCGKAAPSPPPACTAACTLTSSVARTSRLVLARWDSASGDNHIHRQIDCRRGLATDCTCCLGTASFCNVVQVDTRSSDVNCWIHADIKFFRSRYQERASHDPEAILVACICRTGNAAAPLKIRVAVCLIEDINLGNIGHSANHQAQTELSALGRLLAPRDMDRSYKRQHRQVGGICDILMAFVSMDRL